MSPTFFAHTPWSNSWGISTEFHRIHRSQYYSKIKHPIKTYYILSSFQSQFSKDVFQIEMCIHRNKASSLCANAQTSSSCLPLSPPPRGHWLLASALFCLFSSTNLYPHKWENRTFVKHSHLREYKAYVQINGSNHGYRYI